MKMRNTIIILLAVGLLAGSSVGALGLKVGIVTDIHAHDTDSPGEGKIMTDYPERLGAFVDAMNGWPADLVIELGDFVNGNFVFGPPPGDPARIVDILDEAEGLYAMLDAPRYYVLGNHDVYDLSKEEFVEHTGCTFTYGSFDADGYHFVILDAQYNKDGEDLDHVGWVVQGYIPEVQLEWLKGDLAETEKPTIVCVHQRLDVDVDFLSGNAPEIRNNKDVQRILEESGVVIAVFQGHDHENAYTLINGIHYIEFDQLVNEESEPSWAYVTLDPDARTITIVGEGEQADLELTY